MEPIIVHHPEQCRFIYTENGIEAHVEYEVKGQAFDITHTIVPKELGGRGIAGKLVATAYAYAEAQGYAFLPSCSYAQIWLERKQRNQ